MILKPMKQGLILMALGGMSALIYADAMVIGKNAPDQYQPVNLQATNEFLAAHRSNLPSVQDMAQFSAVTTHGDALVSAGSSSRPSSGRSLLIPNSAFSSAASPIAADATAADSGSPCPAGFKSTYYGPVPLQGSMYDCYENQSITNSKWMTSMSMEYLMDSNHKGWVNNIDFGIDGWGPITYGVTIQKVTYAQGQQGYGAGSVFNTGEYDNYYVGTLKEAQVFKDGMCVGGRPVTYMGPALGADGKPTGYYVIQAVGISGDGVDMSPVPPGETNLCGPPAPSGS